HEVTRQARIGFAARAHASVAALVGRGLSQPSSGAARAARSERNHADVERFPVRRRAARAVRSIAVDRSAWDVVQEAGLRLARDMVGPLDRAARTRRTARLDRPGLGSTRIADAARRSQAIPTGAGCLARATAARSGRGVARSLRPPRLS